MFEENINNIKIDSVEWGVVVKIRCGNTIYLIYGPSFTETARRIADRLYSEGFDVVMLNEGNDYDFAVASKLRSIALQHLQRDC